MSWMTDFADPATVRERALKSLSMPVGFVNPLWLAFGAAASAGAAWWLMTRWAAPFNAEAVFGLTTGKITAPVDVEKSPQPPPIVPEIAKEAAPVVAEADSTIGATVETAAKTMETVQEQAHEVVESETAAFAQTVEDTEALWDDLTRLVGLGPRSAAALAERGVNRFADLAAWTDEQLAAFDADMKLKGRTIRSAWREQAKRLAAEV